MTLSILIWNAQHLDNQSGTPSEAYLEKLAFLGYCVDHAQNPIDILVLMETGKTGNPNELLIKHLARGFTEVAVTSQEDGAKKHTTLGILVLVSKAKAKEFARVEGIVLGNEQRSAVVIRHESGYAMAFYHANASYAAAKNVRDTLTFIQDNLEAYKITKLGFFGGDLNTDAKSADDTLSLTYSVPLDSSNPYSKKVTNRTSLKKLTPNDSGYTHASFRRQWEAQQVASAQQGNRVILKRHYQAVLRLLDYAYVNDLHGWSASCEAAYTAPVVNGIAQQPVRHSRGMRMRSDHYPVIYTYSGGF
jgi:hypothetical protein